MSSFASSIVTVASDSNSAAALQQKGADSIVKQAAAEGLPAFEAGQAIVAAANGDGEGTVKAGLKAMAIGACMAATSGAGAVACSTVVGPAIEATWPMLRSAMQWIGGGLQGAVMAAVPSSWQAVGVECWPCYTDDVQRRYFDAYGKMIGALKQSAIGSAWAKRMGQYGGQPHPMDENLADFLHQWVGWTNDGRWAIGSSNEPPTPMMMLMEPCTEPGEGMFGNYSWPLAERPGASKCKRSDGTAGSSRCWPVLLSFKYFPERPDAKLAQNTYNVAVSMLQARHDLLASFCLEEAARFAAGKYCLDFPLTRRVWDKSTLRAPQLGPSTLSGQSFASAQAQEESKISAQAAAKSRNTIKAIGIGAGVLAIAGGAAYWYKRKHR